MNIYENLIAKFVLDLLTLSSSPQPYWFIETQVKNHHPLDYVQRHTVMSVISSLKKKGLIEYRHPGWCIVGTGARLI